MEPTLHYAFLKTRKPLIDEGAVYLCGESKTRDKNRQEVTNKVTRNRVYTSGILLGIKSRFGEIYMKAVLNTFISFGAILLLSSCGRELCVGPFGNCYSQPFKNGPATQAGGSAQSVVGGQLMIKLPNPANPSHTFEPGAVITLIGSGGSGKYRWTIHDGDDAQIPNESELLNQVSFKAPSRNGIKFLITLEDTTNRNSITQPFYTERNQTKPLSNPKTITL
jgi:hypothetical protein